MTKYIIGKIKGYVDFYNLVDFVKIKYNFAVITEKLNRDIIAPLAICHLEAQVNEHSDNTEYWYNMLGTVKIPHRGKNKDIGYCYDNLSVKEEVETFCKWNLKESMETTTISIGYDTDGEKETNKSIIAEIIEHFGGGWISDDLEHYTEVKEKADFAKAKQTEKRIQVAYDVAKYYGENFSYYLEKLCEIPEKYRKEAFAGIDKAYEKYWSDKSCRKEEFSAKMPEFGKKDTDGKKKRTYHLAGNDWYAVMEDGEKIMLVDTDCKTGGRELETPWSDRDWSSKEGENGQCILNYTNYIADTYFNGIKHAIMPRTVEAGAGKLEDAYMWPMSKEEFDSNKVVSKKIAENSCGVVWTRTFGVNCGNYRDAWYVNGAGGDLNYSNVRRLCRVAPAFYLKKSEVDHITDDGEIILKPEEQKGEFITDGSKTYHLAGNDWYAVTEDDKMIMLVDTDCKIYDEKLGAPWSDGDWENKEENVNGQAILDYCNNLVDKYFGKVKHVIIPRNVDAGTGELENAYMWPMSRREFIDNKVVGGKIACNSNGGVWTRTPGGFSNSNYHLGSYHLAWYVCNNKGDLYYTVIGSVCRVAPAFYLKKSAIDHITDDGEIILKPEEPKGKFVTDGSKVYRLGGNDWYAVMEDNDKIMLVDTDCKIADKKLGAPWSNGCFCNKEGENGRYILNYVNRLTDTYFSTIKYAIMPRTVAAGTGKLENALMWPMSKEEFEDHKDIGGKIFKKIRVWTRTFSGVGSDSSNNNRYAWYVDNASGDLDDDYGNVSCVNYVAPAFYLRKSAIDHVTEDGEIVLKPVEQEENNEKENLQRLVQMASYPELLSVLTRLAESEAGFIITDPAGELKKLRKEVAEEKEKRKNS